MPPEHPPTGEQLPTGIVEDATARLPRATRIGRFRLQVRQILGIAVLVALVPLGITAWADTAQVRSTAGRTPASPTTAIEAADLSPVWSATPVTYYLVSSPEQADQALAMVDAGAAKAREEGFIPLPSFVVVIRSAGEKAQFDRLFEGCQGEPGCEVPRVVDMRTGDSDAP
jgi:hypothetical protein